MKKYCEKNAIISALYKIIAQETRLVAWDFPPRTYKKAFIELKNHLKKHNIPISEPKADWPHFSVVEIPKPNSDQEEKIKLVSPVFPSKVKTIKLDIFKGWTTPYTYIVWKLDVYDFNKFKKYIEVIKDIMGMETEKESREKIPHVSIAICDPKYRRNY